MATTDVRCVVRMADGTHHAFSPRPDATFGVEAVGPLVKFRFNGGFLMLPAADIVRADCVDVASEVLP